MNSRLSARRSSQIITLFGMALFGACASTVEPVSTGSGATGNSGASGSSGSSGSSGVSGTSGGSGTLGTGATPGVGGSGVGGAPTAGSPGLGGVAGTPGVGGGTAGSGGAAPVATKLCATKTPLTTPLITNFENYDGATPAGMWGTAFGPGTVYAGPFMVSDMTGTPFLGMVGGANTSNYAVSFSNPAASSWGGALGFWMGCVNASSFQGLSFWLRGAMPTGMMSVSLVQENTEVPAADPAGGGTCVRNVDTDCKAPSAAVAVTPDWTLIQIPWAQFLGGVGSAGAAVTVNGDNIAGLNFGAQLMYVWTPDPSGDGGTSSPAPGAVEIVIDELGFY